MRKLTALVWLGMLCLVVTVAQAQSGDSVISRVGGFPGKLLAKIRSKTAHANDQLTRQTGRYLRKMAGEEQRMQQRLNKVDSAGAKELFANSQQQYAYFLQKLRTDTGSRRSLSSFQGNYHPYLDSLQGSLAFLQQDPAVLNRQGTLSARQQEQLQSATGQLQMLQAKMQDADAAQGFIQQRKQQINQYIQHHANLQNLFTKPLEGVNQQAYYYSQQLRQYREMWDNPDVLEKQALVVLDKLPAFQQ